MIRGIGVDIVHLPRISKLVGKYAGRGGTLQAITAKIMHSREQDTFQRMMTYWEDNSLGKQRCIRYLGGIWASKEAVYKSLVSFVPSNEMLPAKTIYTQLLCKINDPITGAPQIYVPTLSSNPISQSFYNKYLKENKIMVSISHDGEYLIAYTTILSTS